VPTAFAAIGRLLVWGFGARVTGVIGGPAVPRDLRPLDVRRPVAVWKVWLPSGKWGDAIAKVPEVLVPEWLAILWRLEHAARWYREVVQPLLGKRDRFGSAVGGVGGVGA
jgi:hypothetical protein